LLDLLLVLVVVLAVVFFFLAESGKGLLLYGLSALCLIAIGVLLWQTGLESVNGSVLEYNDVGDVNAVVDTYRVDTVDSSLEVSVARWLFIALGLIELVWMFVELWRG